MNTTERREIILSQLQKSENSISASTLAKSLSVSRQIIVGDIALLRASGLNISATPRGYLLNIENHTSPFGYTGILACIHGATGLKEELYTVVDFGGTLINVTIEHPLYGQLTGLLDIGSRHEADLFLKLVLQESSQQLCTITGGVHLHSIGCKDEKTFGLISDALSEKKILLL